MKHKIESEYMEFASDTRCAIALKEAAKILGLDEDALPVIKVDADWLDHNLNWLENEKSKGLFVYNSHIAATKNHLIDVYPKVKPLAQDLVMKLKIETNLLNGVGIEIQ